MNPKDIRGTKTGVYVGLMTNESSDYFERSPDKLTGYETIGAIRSMLANRLSFQYDFKGIGPSSRRGSPRMFVIVDKGAPTEMYKPKGGVIVQM